MNCGAKWRAANAHSTPPSNYLNFNATCIAFSGQGRHEPNAEGVYPRPPVLVEFQNASWHHSGSLFCALPIPIDKLVTLDLNASLAAGLCNDMAL